MNAETLKEKRAQTGMSVTQFANYLGVSFWTLYQWESGRRKVSMEPFSLAVALATATRARQEGKQAPDWRREPVMPEGVKL